MYDDMSDRELRNWLNSYQRFRRNTIRDIEKEKRAKNYVVVRSYQKDLKVVDGRIRNIKRELARRKERSSTFRNPASFNYFANLERMLR